MHQKKTAFINFEEARSFSVEKADAVRVRTSSRP